MDSYQIPWRWPRCEHLSKMKIFWKHSAIFLPHAFATKFIMNSNKIPSAAFHAKGRLHVHFLGTSRRDYHRAVGCTKKVFCWSILSLLNSSALQKLFCYWHLLEKWNASSHLLPWRPACRGERWRRGVSGHPPPPCLHHMHPVPGLRTQPLLKIRGL